MAISYDGQAATLLRRKPSQGVKIRDMREASPPHNIIPHFAG